MAQAQAEPEEKPEEEPQEKFEPKGAMVTSVTTNTSCSSSSNGGGSNNGVSFKFNAHAQEFVPRSHTQIPISGYYYPCFHYLGGAPAAGSSDWFLVGDQERAACLISNPNISIPHCSSKNVLTDDLRVKIIKQVPFLISLSYLLIHQVQE